MNYGIGNQELLAVKLALEEWRHWLEGAAHPFLVLTDHKNLEYLHTAKWLNSRQACWSILFPDLIFPHHTALALKIARLIPYPAYIPQRPLTQNLKPFYPLPGLSQPSHGTLTEKSPRHTLIPFPLHAPPSSLMYPHNSVLNSWLGLTPHPLPHTWCTKNT